MEQEARENAPAPAPEAPRPGRELKREGARRWLPPGFTAAFRGQPTGPPPVGPWEDVLLQERTLAHRLVTALAPYRLARRVLGIPPALASEPGASLEARAERARAVSETRLARALRRAPAPPEPRARPRETDFTENLPGPPRVGPLLGHEIDRALALLASVSFEEIQRRGWHFQPNHFYWPLNDLAFLRSNLELWVDRREPAGIDWDLDGQVALAERLAAHAGKLAKVREGPPERPGEYVWGNGTFTGWDAYVYYGLVRELRPSRVIEVGSGWSSLLLARATAANANGCRVTLVEPGPDFGVLGELPEGWDVLTSLVQHVDPALFTELGAGDVLFYDGSHCVRTGSDVNWIFFEVLPRLAPGVWVHVHDLAWPGDYGPEFVLDEGLSWNEQYLVQAFLMHNDSYEVRFSSSMTWAYRRKEVKAAFPGKVAGSSLWLEKVGPATPPRR